MATVPGSLDWSATMTDVWIDNECAGCLRIISAPNVWLCDTCVSRAVEAGFEATPFHHPGNECTEFLWKKALEAQRAKTT